MGIRQLLLWVIIVLAAGCGQSPAAPRQVVFPLSTGNVAMPPVIKSISVPANRQEAGVNIIVSAVVEDLSPSASPLLYEWAANVGVVIGNGPVATFRLAPGKQKGVDVVITLTVVKRYLKGVANNAYVAQEFRVVAQAAPFRVHDSVAEQKELARKFLIDLFGNSAVPPLACLVDFSDVGRCAKGKADELEDITAHRRDYIVIAAKIFSQYVVFTGPDSGEVHSDASFTDVKITGNDPPMAGDARGDFWLTTVYESKRWWLCESHFTPPGTSGVATIKRSRGRTVPIVK